MRLDSRLKQRKRADCASIGLRKAIGDDIGFNMGAIARDTFGNALGASIGQGIVQMTENRGLRTDSELLSSDSTGGSNTAKGAYFGSVGKDVFAQMANESLNGFDMNNSDDDLFNAMLNSTPNINHSSSSQSADDIVKGIFAKPISDGMNGIIEHNPTAVLLKNTSDKIGNIGNAADTLKYGFETTKKAEVTNILRRAGNLQENRLVKISRASSLEKARDAFVTNSRSASAGILDNATNSRYYKGLGIVGKIAGPLQIAANSASAYYENIGSGANVVAREVTSAAVGTTASVLSAGLTTWAATETGALAGAAIGSVFPGPGTLIGAFAGGAIGGAVAFTANVIFPVGDWIQENTGNVVRNVWNYV
ncbi:MAG: hypothetical protein O2809_09690 [Proteobacteria bacterium]|nr:hypothetical protein [Pseudomonadota bacterium]